MCDSPSAGNICSLHPCALWVPHVVWKQLGSVSVVKLGCSHGSSKSAQGLRPGQAKGSELSMRSGGELQRKGRTLWVVIKGKDEELALFLEMRRQEKERGAVAVTVEQLMRSDNGVYAVTEGMLLVDPSLISSWESLLLQSVLT
ncbi:hypothetical protein GUJ93_ZPchr0011g28267 [Zizania palustris]|uniref:Uncharacterized protein n=1 Tax=Zizania palustris TaxID=103762 RepID=A0A8J5WL28_ZIZPA|nr:hypothetical protein GUJ93_ZPchr0011g28267 [Zizania palustris]